MNLCRTTPSLKLVNGAPGVQILPKAPAQATQCCNKNSLQLFFVGDRQAGLIVMKYETTYICQTSNNAT